MGMKKAHSETDSVIYNKERVSKIIDSTKEYIQELKLYA